MLLPKDSPLTSTINYGIIRSYEAGILHELNKKWKLTLPIVKQEAAFPLSLRHITLVFMTAFVGYLISAFAFIIEHFSKFST